jgi:16S rRNA processing protein RimM
MSGRSGTLRIGKIAGTHGIRGHLRVQTFSEEYEALMALESVMLKGPDGRMDSFELASARPHGKKAVIALKGYDNINQVLHLVGREIFADREQFPVLPDGEYYWCDIIGIKVYLDTGEFLGEITDIIPTGSNDVYVVQAEGKEVLVPAIESVVVSIDPEKGLMRVSLLEGLLDL